MKEAGLTDYLVLLSIYQTCRYKGVSFLKFLLSRERDVDAYRQRQRQKGSAVEPESYPPGYSRGGCRRKKANATKAGSGSAAAASQTSRPPNTATAAGG